MKNVLIIFLVGAVLFAGSASLSWYMQQQNLQNTPDGHATEAEKPGKAAATPRAGDKPHANDGPLVSPLRPPPNLNPDNVVVMAEKVRQQQDTLRTREQALAVRQKGVELVYQDMKAERKSLDELRTQIGAEMKALQEKMDQVDRKNAELVKQRDLNTDKLQEVKGSMATLDRLEEKNLKPLFDKLEPSVAGEMLQQMADSGKMDMAARILVSVKDSQAASVLAQIPDRSVAVQLVERMKGLKRLSKTDVPD